MRPLTDVISFPQSALSGVGGHSYEWQEVGRYCAETVVAAVPVVVPLGGVAVPHCHNTSLFELVYGTIDSVKLASFALA